MPRATTSSLPMSGLFAINKPSGMTSMALIETLKPLFRQSTLFVSEESAKEAIKSQGKSKKFYKRRGPKIENGDIKIGQGGTLDPLADGVLVIGINKGTKKLSQFLECSKTYVSTGLLNCSTDSYDSQGMIIDTYPHKVISEAMVRESLSQFRGEIMQLPPIFSALKMDGKPLYSYAREGIPLPRPIEKRKANISHLEMVEWREGGSHPYQWPEKKLEGEELDKIQQIKTLVGESLAKTEGDDSERPCDKQCEVLAKDRKSDGDLESSNDTPVDSVEPPAFVLEMTVSSGTYVRSIIHDIGQSLGSAAHVVTLKRTRQGEFALGDCVEWKILQDAVNDLKSEKSSDEGGVDGEMKPWEEAILKVFRSV